MTLHLLDMPAMRRLHQALLAAAEVDCERGDYPDGQNEYLFDLAARVGEQISGPVGSGRE